MLNYDLIFYFGNWNSFLWIGENMGKMFEIGKYVIVFFNTMKKSWEKKVRVYWGYKKFSGFKMLSLDFEV